ncbi:hypothetical protein VNI00_006677 [Paramarasmius palmivorus]|uniref:Uncharacterized protein n=1 Tax=Paramarasmius palmivorus TaxID=297713 RepID=A0AAW0D556_9AGAR
MPKEQKTRKPGQSEKEELFKRLNKVQLQSRNLMSFNSERQSLEVVDYPTDDRGNPLLPDEAAQFFIGGSAYQVFCLLCMCNKPARCFQVKHGGTSIFAGKYIACCFHEKGTFGACTYFRCFDQIYEKGPLNTAFYGRIPGYTAGNTAASSSQNRLPTPPPSSPLKPSPVKSERRSLVKPTRRIRIKREESPEVEIVGEKKAGVCCVCHKPEVKGVAHKLTLHYFSTSAFDWVTKVPEKNALKNDRLLVFLCISFSPTSTMVGTVDRPWYEFEVDIGQDLKSQRNLLSVDCNAGQMITIPWPTNYARRLLSVEETRDMIVQGRIEIFCFHANVRAYVAFRDGQFQVLCKESGTARYCAFALNLNRIHDRSPTLTMYYPNPSAGEISRRIEANRLRESINEELNEARRSRRIAASAPVPAVAGGSSLSVAIRQSRVASEMKYFLRSSVKQSLPGPPAKNDAPIEHLNTSELEGAIEPIHIPNLVDIDSLVERAEREALENSNVAEDLGIHVLETRPFHSSTFQVSTTTQNPPVAPKIEGQSRGNAKRAEKRREKRKADSQPNSKDRINKEAVQPAVLLRKDFDGAKLDASRGAYIGNRGGKKVLGTRKEIEAEYDVQQLIRMGFQHETWDGYTAKPIVINNEFIVGVLAGQPRRPDYGRDMLGIHNLVLQKGKEYGLQEHGQNEDNKRGDFPARSRGYTMGMGSQQPVVLDNGTEVNELLTELIQDQRIIRLNGYQNGAFGTWAERIKGRYDDAIATMHKNITKEDSERGRNFKNSAFATIAFNFGGKVRCWKHRDQQNLPLGWCAITVLGRFDPTRSARLILWELKLVIDFPPGSTILIPSAVITHSNTRIAPGDERTSITQYTAGAIFRWVDAGCLTEKALKSTNKEAWKKHNATKVPPVSERLGIFSRVDEVLSRAC